MGHEVLFHHLRAPTRLQPIEQRFQLLSCGLQVRWLTRLEIFHGMDQNIPRRGEFGPGGMYRIVNRRLNTQCEEMPRLCEATQTAMEAVTPAGTDRTAQPVQ